MNPTSTTFTTYKFWCAYCGVEMLIKQQFTPTPEQQVCSYCKNILDYYQEESKLDVLR